MDFRERINSRIEKEALHFFGDNDDSESISKRKQYVDNRKEEMKDILSCSTIEEISDDMIRKRMERFMFEYSKREKSEDGGDDDDEWAICTNSVKDGFCECFLCSISLDSIRKKQSQESEESDLLIPECEYEHYIVVKYDCEDFSEYTEDERTEISRVWPKRHLYLNGEDTVLVPRPLKKNNKPVKDVISESHTSVPPINTVDDDRIFKPKVDREEMMRRHQRRLKKKHKR